jgi:8-oxo-dGTP pyrophosphatase MutT (NUDIX family)
MTPVALVWSLLVGNSLTRQEYSDLEHDSQDKEPVSKRSAATKTVAESQQVAALPLRLRAGRLEVCLVTTRTTRRWTIPKGWPMKGIKDHLAAGIEAEQEAGLRGKAGKRAIGSYLYWKRFEDRFELVRVTVFRFDVEDTLPSFREQDQREVRWFPIEEARELVDEPGLAAIILASGGDEAAISP